MAALSCSQLESTINPAIKKNAAQGEFGRSGVAPSEQCLRCKRLTNLMFWRSPRFVEVLGKSGFWRRRRDSNPRYRIYQYDGLANRWFQPLTHVSRLQRRGRYSEPRGGRQVRLLAGEIRPHRVCRRAEFGPSARNSCCPARFRLGSSPVHCRFATCGFHCAMRDCVRALRDRARGGAHLDRGTDRQ